MSRRTTAIDVRNKMRPLFICVPTIRGRNSIYAIGALISGAYQRVWIKFAKRLFPCSTESLNILVCNEKASVSILYTLFVLTVWPNRGISCRGSTTGCLNFGGRCTRAGGASSRHY